MSVAAVRLDWVPGEVESVNAEGTFDAFYRREYRSLVGLAFALTGRREIAEDLVQEAMLRAHARWGRVATMERPDMWVRRVLVNLATSRGRRLAAETRALARVGREREGSAPAVSAEAAMFWERVRRLPKRQAQVMALYYVEDWSTADIAAALECAEGTVRAHLHAARTSLSEDKEFRS